MFLRRVPLLDLVPAYDLKRKRGTASTGLGGLLHIHIVAEVARTCVEVSQKCKRAPKQMNSDDSDAEIEIL